MLIAPTRNSHDTFFPIDSLNPIRHLPFPRGEEPRSGGVGWAEEGNVVVAFGSGDDVEIGVGEGGGRG